MGGLLDGLFVTGRVIVGIGTLGLSEWTVQAISSWFIDEDVYAARQRAQVQQVRARRAAAAAKVQPPQPAPPVVEAVAEPLKEAVAVVEAVAQPEEEAVVVVEAVDEPEEAAPELDESVEATEAAMALAQVERLKGHFRDRKIKTAVSAKKLLAKIVEARGKLSEEERRHLKVLWLDGDDIALMTIFKNTKILSSKPGKREQLYTTEFAKHAKSYILAELEAAGVKRAGNAKTYDALKMAREEELETLRESAETRLQDAAELARIQKFLAVTKGRKLGFEDARTVIYLHPGAEDRLEQAQRVVDRLFAGDGLLVQDAALVEAFFPAKPA
jgi:hypothetical protein